MYYYDEKDNIIQLSGKEILWSVSQIKSFTQCWVKNDAGGEEHYHYGGQPCFVSLYVYRSPSGEVIVTDGNGKDYNPSMVEQDYIKNDLVDCNRKMVKIGYRFHWVYE